MWAKQDVERYLMQAVCDYRLPLYYGDLYTIMDVDSSEIAERNAFHDLLGAISHDHYSRDLPMLSVIVIRQQNQRPGNGFYNLARGIHPDYVGVPDDDIYALEFGKVEQNRDAYQRMLASK